MHLCIQRKKTDMSSIIVLIKKQSDGARRSIGQNGIRASRFKNEPKKIQCLHEFRPIVLIQLQFNNYSLICFQVFANCECTCYAMYPHRGASLFLAPFNKNHFSLDLLFNLFIFLNKTSYITKIGCKGPFDCLHRPEGALRLLVDSPLTCEARCRTTNVIAFQYNSENTSEKEKQRKEMSNK